MTQEPMVIDDSLYSRQRYVLGDEGMHSLSRASVLICGLGGLGVEIAKNLVLAGVKTLHIQDSKPCTLNDMGSQFYITEEDVSSGKTRAEASLPRLAELNPYVTIEIVETNLKVCAEKKLEDLSFLAAYKVVVLTECELLTINYADYYCHQHNIQVVVADVIGLMGSIFCDFGPTFTVTDSTGEESREIFVNIKSEEFQSSCLLTTLYNEPHGLQDGDLICLKDLDETYGLCHVDFSVTVKSPDSFLINCNSAKMKNISARGRAFTRPKPAVLHFNTFHTEVRRPHLQCVDLGKASREKQLHATYLLLKRLYEIFNRFVEREDDLDVIDTMAGEVCDGLKINSDFIDDMRPLLLTSSGYFQPLAAFLGGVAAQEVLKAISRKFTPLQQWMHVDCVEVADLSSDDISIVYPYVGWRSGCRFLPLLRCIHTKGMEVLANAKIFLVGCGAIGCEMLKNLSMLGIGMSGSVKEGGSFTCSDKDHFLADMEDGNGGLFITDDDHIEKSNLNRQFLFRMHHIRESKSVVARSAAMQLNPDMCITAFQKRVCAATEGEFNDVFYKKLDACINALDNMEARRYMDARCVTNGCSLFESGTLGTKGHVQTIVAHLTEHYTAQQDPIHETEVAYCTLKSFPANLEHCIEWAREKFLSQFHQKPQLFTSIWSRYGFEEGNFFNALRTVSTSMRDVSSNDMQQEPQPMEEVDLSHILTGEMLSMLRFLRYKPVSWSDCVKLARLKFEKHFNHKAKQLLHNFPVDSKLSDGSLFWQSPKRPPTPLTFSLSDENCLLYLRSTAQLLAQVCRIPFTKTDLQRDELEKHLAGLVIEEFKPVEKVIITNESLKKEDLLQEQQNQEATTSVKKSKKISTVSEVMQVVTEKKRCYPMQFSSILMNCEAEEFEKDNDENGHIDFVAAASNLRAKMYGIDTADRYHIKRIAGRIIPAIATTTAAVAGLATIELVKYLIHRQKITLDRENEIQRYRNAFLNLALPLILLSEPGPALVKRISDTRSFTVWDTEIFMQSQLPDQTMKGIKFALEDRFGLPVSMIIYGKRILYSDILPGHEVRLKRNFMDLLRCDVDESMPYVDLLVTFRNYYPKVKDNANNVQDDYSAKEDDDRDVEGPRIRFYIQ